MKRIFEFFAVNINDESWLWKLTRWFRKNDWVEYISLGEDGDEPTTKSFRGRTERHLPQQTHMKQNKSQ